MYPLNLIEEELKNKVATDFFSLNALPQNASKEQKETFKNLDSTKILGRVDFCISYYAQSLFQSLHFLWAEAKRGKVDLIHSFIQLILTIGKERPFEDELPPLFLGAFDCEKIAFVPYHEIDSVFSQNDFNWNVAPSNYDTKEFKQLHAQLSNLLESKKLLFSFKTDSKELKEFIALNFTLTNSNLHKMPITKNNFTAIYQKWREIVAPSIRINWSLAKNLGIIEADFYLADLLSSENQSLLDRLFVVLKTTRYEFNKTTTFMGTEQQETAEFNDEQKAHTSFWNLYERPPKEEYWSYIIDRRDRLVPLDIRERKGAFFTPQVWVKKAHEYLEKALGENYQSEYYIWDCAAGTGNLLANLTESRNLYASTLDKADVAIMHELAAKTSLHLLEDHIFQFDFLNDYFFDKPCEEHAKNGLDSECSACAKSKLPKSLQEILKDDEKRKKLIIFINPPYAEASSYGENGKAAVANQERMFAKYASSVGAEALSELFAQFFFRIYCEIEDCKLAAFSTLKYITSVKFENFRSMFQAKFLKGFMCPAYTFDNVKGQFPIGFLVWDLSQKVKFRKIKLDIFDTDKAQTKSWNSGRKTFSAIATNKIISTWRNSFYDTKNKTLAQIILVGASMQSNNNTFITTKAKESYVKKKMVGSITQNNLIPFIIYFAVRHCIKATWLNDRDQFLYPNNKWQQDFEFHSDCLAFMLFHSQNKISCKEGINHFIPFSEVEVGVKEAFSSNFMVQFLKGKIKPESESLIKSKGTESSKQMQILSDDFYTKDQSFIPTAPLQFSDEAKAVFEAGRKLWSHYHAQAKDSEIYQNDAALYDIKAYFQGFDSKGKMNTPSKAEDSYYKDTLGELNYALHTLAKKIEAKVYEYEFLME